MPKQLKNSLLANISDGANHAPQSTLDTSEGYGLSQRSSHTSHTTLLQAVAGSLKSTIEDDALIKKIQDNIFNRLNRKHPKFQLRVQDGSYSVTRLIDPTTGSKAASDNVVSASLCYKLWNLIKASILRRGQNKARLEKIILQKVNLCLETGKMYLVLGAPGSGVSHFVSSWISDTA